MLGMSIIASLLASTRPARSADDSWVAPAAKARPSAKPNAASSSADSLDSHGQLAQQPAIVNCMASLIRHSQRRGPPTLPPWRAKKTLRTPSRSPPRASSSQDGQLAQLGQGDGQFGRGDDQLGQPAKTWPDLFCECEQDFLCALFAEEDDLEVCNIALLEYWGVGWRSTGPRVVRCDDGSFLIVSEEGLRREPSTVWPAVQYDPHQVLYGQHGQNPIGQHAHEVLHGNYEQELEDFEGEQAGLLRAIEEADRAEETDRSRRLLRAIDGQRGQGEETDRAEDEKVGQHGKYESSDDTSDEYDPFTTARTWVPKGKWNPGLNGGKPRWRSSNKRGGRNVQRQKAKARGHLSAGSTAESMIVRTAKSKSQARAGRASSSTGKK